MAFVKSPSSSGDVVRPCLEGVAKNLADRLWGQNGLARGTPLAELESVVLVLRQILSDKLLHLALQRKADDHARTRGIPSVRLAADEQRP